VNLSGILFHVHMAMKYEQFSRMFRHVELLCMICVIFLLVVFKASPFS
jgi:hypothetical protein